MSKVETQLAGQCLKREQHSYSQRGTSLSRRARRRDCGRETEIGRVPDNNVLGSGQFKFVYNRADVGYERGSGGRDGGTQTGGGGAPGYCGERGPRVVAATLDDIKRIGRGDVVSRSEISAAWTSRLNGKPPGRGPGVPVVAPPNAKLVPPASEGCSGTPSCDAASDAHTGPLL